MHLTISGHPSRSLTASTKIFLAIGWFINCAIAQDIIATPVSSSIFSSSTQLASSTQSSLPSSDLSIGGVRLTLPVGITSCGKLPITWTFDDPSTIVSEAAFQTKVRIWVTNIGVDQSSLLQSSAVLLSSTQPSTSSLPPSSASLPTTTSLSTTTSSSLSIIPRRFHAEAPPPNLHSRQAQLPNNLNVTVTDSHSLIAASNLTWSPAQLPPNKFYKIWMESLDFSLTPTLGLAVRASSGRFLVTPGTDQTCLLMPISPATGTLNTEGSESKKGALHGGAIAGVVIGVLVGVAAAAALLLCCLRSQTKWNAPRILGPEKGGIYSDKQDIIPSRGFLAMLGLRKDTSSRVVSGSSKTKRRKAFGSNDSSATPLDFRGRSSSIVEPSPHRSNSVDTAEATDDGWKKTSSSSHGLSSSRQSLSYIYQGHRSSSVTSLGGAATATLASHYTPSTVVASYSSVDSKDQILKNADSQEFYEISRSPSHPRQQGRRVSVRSHRTTSLSGMYQVTAPTEEYQMDGVEAWVGPSSAKQDRIHSLPGGAAPPAVLPGSSPTSPVTPSSTEVSATSPSLSVAHHATKTPTKRKPAPAYPDQPGPPPSIISAYGTVYSTSGVSTSSLNTLTAQSGGNGNVKTLGKRGSTLAVGEPTFSGFLGAREGPVHYLIPDMPSK